MLQGLQILRNKTLKLILNAIDQLYRSKLVRSPPRQRTLILNLHRINPYNDQFSEALHPRVFEEVLKFLKRNFSISTFLDIYSNNESKTLPRIVFSFDDGYYDFVEFAVPILNKYGVSCNMNLIGESIVSGNPPFTGKLSATLRCLSDKQLSELNIFNMKGRYSIEEGKLLFRNRLSNYLKSMSVASRQEIIERSSPWFAQALVDCEFSIKDRMIKSCELKYLEGYELGSHSFSHESMAYQTDEFFRNDFIRSKKQFKELEIRHLIYAFPNGSFNDSQIDFLHENGIRDVLLVDASKSQLRRNLDGTSWGRYGFHAKTIEEAKFKILYKSIF
jgi:peptidoglycan/xylan/chitin deacetylase (PgdA/CDA1 family)